MKSSNGSITVDETEFQELFNLYWNTRENSKERLYVINEVNKYVYCYITQRDQSDFDIASEFFLENMQKTRKLIEDYEPAYHISFLAYISSKIKRRYSNFKFRSQKAKTLENINEFYQLNPNMYNKSVFDTNVEYHSEYNKKLNHHLNYCLCHLNIEEEIAIKLYFCFNLGYKEFRYLKLKQGSTDFFIPYRNYLCHVQNKINLEKITRGKIVNKLYISSILLRQNYEANMAKKRRKLLADYYALKKPVPLRLIAEILQTNITNVHRRIKKGSFKIQRYLGDFVLVKTSWRENEIPEWFSRYVA